MTGESPQDLAKTLSGISNPDWIFGRVGLVSAVDPSVDDIAFRLYVIIEACAWKEPFLASYEEFANARGYSKRNVIRKIKHLIELKYVFSCKHSNSRNEYWTANTGQKAGSRNRGLEAGRCATCRRQQPVDPLGVCQVCRKRDRAEQEVAEFLNKGPAPFEAVWLGLYTGGSKSGRKALKQAYLKLTEAA